MRKFRFVCTPCKSETNRLASDPENLDTMSEDGIIAFFGALGVDPQVVRRLLPPFVYVKVRFR